MGFPDCESKVRLSLSPATSRSLHSATYLKVSDKTSPWGLFLSAFVKSWNIVNRLSWAVSFFLFYGRKDVWIRLCVNDRTCFLIRVGNCVKLAAHLSFMQTKLVSEMCIDLGSSKIGPVRSWSEIFEDVHGQNGIL